MVGVQSHLEFNALFYELMIHMEMLKVLVSEAGAVQTCRADLHLILNMMRRINNHTPVLQEVVQVFNPRGIGNTTNSRKTSVKFTYNKNIQSRWLKEL